MKRSQKNGIDQADNPGNRRYGNGQDVQQKEPIIQEVTKDPEDA